MLLHFVVVLVWSLLSAGTIFPHRIMNTTIRVSTTFDCQHVDAMEVHNQFDPVWRQNALSCRLLLILQQMFGFNISFLTQEPRDYLMDENPFYNYPYANETIDIFVKPRAITVEMLKSVSPIEAVFTWRFGFILRRKYSAIMRPYYSLPFAKNVWVCILNMTVLVSIILYITKRWERRLFGLLEINFFYELFIVLGVIYQHYLPNPTKLWSRRFAYFFFIAFAYITHSFYSSNLLSYIVTDKNSGMDLKTLVESDYELRILQNMKVATERRVKILERNMNVIEERIARSKVINISAGLEAVRTSRTALLCDYPTVQTFIAKTFDNEAICELKEIDIFSNVQMYFFASKQFENTEKFKIGTLRIKESGMIKRLISTDRYTPISCEVNTFHVRSQFDHIVAPLLILLSFYVIAGFILFAERVHYERHRVWPYVE